MISSPTLSMPPISQPNFERVFRVIHAMLRNENADATKACLYFGIAGAAILNAHHKLKARPVVGAAAYNLQTKYDDVMAFMHIDDQGCSSSIDAFHCWVEVDGWAVDFMSPLFSEVSQAMGGTSPIPINMFLKPMNLMAQELDAVRAPGTFLYQSNPQLTNELIHDFCETPAKLDIVRICTDWYEPTPGKMKPTMAVGNQGGKVMNVPLSPLRIQGAF